MEQEATLVWILNKALVEASYQGGKKCPLYFIMKDGSLTAADLGKASSKTSGYLWTLPLLVLFIILLGLEWVARCQDCALQHWVVSNCIAQYFSSTVKGPQLLCKWLVPAWWPDGDQLTPTQCFNCTVPNLTHPKYGTKKMASPSLPMGKNSWYFAKVTAYSIPYYGIKKLYDS